MPNSKWDGCTERRKYPNDHDIMIRTLANLENLVANFNKHVAEDAAMAKKLDFANKMIYMALGGLAVLEMIGIIKH